MFKIHITLFFFFECFFALIIILSLTSRVFDYIEKIVQFVHFRQRNRYNNITSTFIENASGRNNFFYVMSNGFCMLRICRQRQSVPIPEIVFQIQLSSYALELSLINNRNSVTQGVGFFHMVSSKNDRSIFFQIFYHFPHNMTRFGVHSGSRFVHKN